ncbi:carbohydrate kinase family protein [Synoicihabitans lomoniglobus]|uniref:Carbohydrate kinase family protein n=1 Tax=Synoicihabitans lomoniglobus TaxID=2909285 RepID=A0AAF0CMG5_9BACT|nr:carbohydrate kinase family protein [Opitutaceae bacterium LMO-M01]WED64083.1 carbohydrate kinase family protein [Opitutaceae bacterium LMO-M01]
MPVAPEPTAGGLERRGVIAGGNFIVDTIISIDDYPREEMLANIIDESPSNGGGPYNVLRDLAALKSPFPLEAVGLVGDDDNGRWIIDDCAQHGISTDRLRVVTTAPTSHTHVMTAQTTGRRTFFHHRGANRLLSPRHFDFAHSSARIFYLGYLMLLDQLDQRDDTGRTGASHVLEAAQAAGLTTVVDLVSVEAPDFRATVAAALPWIDHLIINELEASRFLGRALENDDASALENAAQQILADGVRVAVVIHTPSGAIVASRREGSHSLGSLDLDPTLFRGANGAGDGFAAGYIHGLHEDLPISERLLLANCTAAASLSDPSPSAGVRPSAACLQLAERYGLREWGEGARPVSARQG